MRKIISEFVSISSIHADMRSSCRVWTSLLQLSSVWHQGRNQKFILGGYNFLLHDTTILYTSSLTTSAAISAQNNFQGLILGGYICNDPAHNE